MHFKAKGAILLVALLLLFSTVALASDFCNGFEQGYITGYKKAKSSSLAPMSPMCPMQPMKGFGDPQSDFEHGYIIGLQQGMADGYK